MTGNPHLSHFRLCLCTLLLSFTASTFSQEKPALPPLDCIRLAEAFRVGEQLGNEVWSGWDKAPFAVLLVTPEYEFLIRHPNPSSDFLPLGYDELLRSDVFYRNRVFQPNLLATFPAVNGLSTIVIGQAENTEARTSTRWVLTLLHEHFHQLQNSQPMYFKDVEALNLARGDQSGMWMLNYPFPYDSLVVKTAFAKLCSLLASALQTRGTELFRSSVGRYLEGRREFKSTLKDDDYRYFSFQLWQEGIARYTEYRIAALAAERYEPMKEFRKLPDFIPYRALADSLKKRIMDKLLTIDLGRDRREVVYPFGAAEGLLLDAINPGWQREYFRKKFDVEKYFR